MTKEELILQLNLLGYITKAQNQDVFIHPDYMSVMILSNTLDEYAVWTPRYGRQPNFQDFLDKRD
ncbi:MAG: hypothetical protein HRU18_02615 [Pseudoalteromonas sp.]|uniref:hypothetical protein n=1 Tax=Pseudoalteromonas sp. TaxID=53249 RepID=UPI001E0949F6|nr:hypothetical protein [Pseudoalteromonas sp.]NRA77076.1 hypothetical protein [Pseudoalteromonas sp.]